MRVVSPVVLLLLSACGGEHRAAREKYNEGVAALGKADFDAAEKALIDARSQAGVDPELRFRAAYDLGTAYAGHSETARTGESPDLARALDLAQHAASWLSDAARLRKDDADTQANLAIVRARVQSISDEMRKGEGKLETRLDALIGEQRQVLDDARGAWVAIREAGGADPLAQQGTLTHLADRERGVVAEAGVIGDLADDETAKIGQKPKDQRKPEEEARVVQLDNLGHYLNEARARISEARRKLQELAAENGVARSEAALVALKRAREQLLDPINALKGVAQDQIAVFDETSRAAADAKMDAKAPPAPLPAWLAPTAISEREGGLRDRVEELRARLAAFAEHKVEPTKDKPADPKREKLVQRVSAALPAVIDAIASMEHAKDELGAGRPKPAIEHERSALDALARAIEEFADLKNLIELAHAQQNEVVALLSPEAAKEVEPALRASRTKDGIARNRSRMARLRDLITEAVADVDEKAKQPPAPQPGAPPGAPAPDPEEAKKHAEQEKQRLARAETLRGEAAKALDALDKALAANEDPQPPAKEADAKIEEMRKLFFSVVEHLQQLIRDQSETRDKTSAANADAADARAPKLPELAKRETDHSAMATAIKEALAKQADAAAATPKQQGAKEDKSLPGAVEEMRLAETSISEARDALTKARDAKTTSEDLAPTVKTEDTAIEHLVEALKRLQPPKKNNKEQQQQDEQQQKAGQKPQQGGEQQAAGGAAQRARDDDARRQRERRAKEGRTEPVEKDW